MTWTMGVVDTIWVLIVSTIAWPKLSLMIKCLSLPCLSSIHRLSSRSCLGAHQHAINGSAWPKIFEVRCDLKAVTCELVPRSARPSNDYELTTRSELKTSKVTKYI